jgi:hypothetical protein
MIEPNDFNWSSRRVVVKPVDAIAVYKNADGDVVIRQQARPPNQQDSLVVVPLVHAWSLIEALTREVKYPSPAQQLI